MPHFFAGSSKQGKKVAHATSNPLSKVRNNKYTKPLDTALLVEHYNHNVEVERRKKEKKNAKKI
jgi:hypothetical protein